MAGTRAPFGRQRKSRHTRGPSISERPGAMGHVTALVTQVSDRIERIREVVVSVDRHGRLMSLQLASSSTARFTCEALECLINDTVRAAVDLAVRPDRQLV